MLILGVVQLNCQLSKQPFLWSNSFAESCVKEHGGSKAGLVNFVQNEVTDLIDHLPSGSQFVPGDEINQAIKKLDFSQAKIIRACHPRDFVGLVDAIPSHVANSLEEAEEILEEIHEHLSGPDFKSFYKWETGQDFDGKVDFLIQDFAGRARGSIVEQPSDPGMYRVVTLYDGNRDNQPPHPNQFFDDQGRQLARSSLWEFKGKNGKTVPDEFLVKPGARFSMLNELQYASSIPYVIGLYRSLKDSGFVPESHSFQMEFGVNQEQVDKPRIFQARPFRPYEARGDFDIEDGIYGTGYGVTPGQDLVLPVRLIRDHLKDGRKQALYNKSYGHSERLDVQPDNMEVYVSPVETIDILDHGDFRWLQKAPIVSCGAIPQNGSLTESLAQSGSDQMIRVRCNAIASEVKLEQ